MNVQKRNNEPGKLSFLDQVMEVVGWIRIMVSPFLVGLIAGAVVYLWIGNSAGIIAGALIAVLGLIAGILFANKVWRRKGTVHFMSRINAFPEAQNLIPGQGQEKSQSPKVVEKNS